MSKVLDDLRAYENTIPNEQKPAVVAAIKELERLEGTEPAPKEAEVHSFKPSKKKDD